MTPGAGGRLFALSLGWGLGLGIFGGMLRPMGSRHRNIADGCFLAATFHAWLRVSFGLCGGDLRPAWLFGLGLGWLLWRQGPGRLADGIWWPIWGLIWKILDIIRGFRKKVLKFLKFFFPSWRKWVTIGSNQSKPSPMPTGGAQMEAKPRKKIVLKPGSRGLKWLCAGVVLLALAALVGMHWVRQDLVDLTQSRQRQAAALEQENARITRQQQELGSVDSVKDIAQSELGYVDPDAVVIGEK